MQFKLHRFFLIMMLALVMTSGSFLVSMADAASDLPQGNPPSSTDISSDTEQAVEEVQDATAVEAPPAVKDAAVEEKAIAADAIEEEKDDAEVIEKTDADSASHVHDENCSHDHAQEVVVKSETIQETVSAVQSAPAMANVVPAEEGNKAESSSSQNNDIDPPKKEEPKNSRLYEPGSMAGHTRMYYCPAKEAAVCEDGELEHYHCNACGRNFDVYQAEYNNKAVEINIVVPAMHSPADPVEENRVDPTCEEAGSYDEVVYCKICDKELSRDTIEVPALGHTPADAVEENLVEPTYGKAGSYDEVTYCAVCGNELSRETIMISALPSYVVVDGPHGSGSAMVEEDGTAVLEDFFWALEPGQEEFISMSVGGKTYSFTRYADGKVIGKLPSGFAISGNDLRISGLSNLKSDLDIKVSEHWALGGGIFEDYYDDAVVDEEALIGAGAYSEPDVTNGNDAVTTAANNDGAANVRANYTGNNTGRANYTGAGAGTTRGVNSLAESMLGSVTGNDANAADDAALDNAEDKPSASSFFKAEPGNGSESGLSFGSNDANASNTPSALLIVVDIALIFSLILGIGVLWKLGLLRIKR